MTQSLFYLLNSSEACSKTGSLQQLLKWNQVDLNGDRNPDLQAIVKSGVYLRRGATPKAPCDGQLFTGPSRNYTLEYTFDGAQFMPTKATREMITELLKDNPNFLGPID